MILDNQGINENQEKSKTKFNVNKNTKYHHNGLQIYKNEPMGQSNNCLKNKEINSSCVKTVLMSASEIEVKYCFKVLHKRIC